MTVDRRIGLPKIHCAFARKTDAAGFAQALNASAGHDLDADQVPAMPDRPLWRCRQREEPR